MVAVDVLEMTSDEVRPTWRKRDTARNRSLSRWSGTRAGRVRRSEVSKNSINRIENASDDSVVVDSVWSQNATSGLLRSSSSPKVRPATCIVSESDKTPVYRFCTECLLSPLLSASRLRWGTRTKGMRRRLLFYKTCGGL